MLTTILFWSACAIVYLFIGTVIGHISVRVWKKQTHASDSSQEIIRSPAFLILFPRTYAKGSIGLQFPPIIDEINPKSTNQCGTYLMAHALLWPLKVAWSAFVLSLLAIFHSFTFLLHVFMFPFNLIVRRTWVEEQKKAMASRTRVAELKPADKLDSLKHELGDTELQIKKLQDKSKELLEEIQRLENQRAAEQGATVFRADMSSESKWRPSSSN
ncbi:MAG: hypothetical protein WCW31_05905 [Patescibacteria group bacterium]|jgi:cell division protein FtsB